MQEVEEPWSCDCKHPDKETHRAARLEVIRAGRRAAGLPERWTDEECKRFARAVGPYLV